MKTPACALAFCIAPQGWGVTASRVASGWALASRKSMQVRTALV
jgi:hypothetical protein